MYQLVILYLDIILIISFHLTLTYIVRVVF